MMRSHSYRRRDTKTLHCLSNLPSLLVATWLLALTGSASILRDGSPLELGPPSDQAGSYFGFSLAHYLNNNERWLLVGAPRSNISDSNVPNSGGLYQCPLSDDTRARECSVVHVNLDNSAPYTVWAKSNNTDQGLGFSLASSDKEIVVCAPHWYASKSVYNRISYLPVGMCFAATSPDLNFEVFSPPFVVDNTTQMSFLTTGYCQLGMSATRIKGLNTFVLGSPGCWGWQGEAFEVEPSSKSMRYIHQLQPEDVNLELPVEWSFYNLYLGYSVASITFRGTTAIVASIPHSTWDETNSTAKFGPAILILKHDSSDSTRLKVMQRISPSKSAEKEVTFSFFGYSLATLDANGDGLEDLVVGAPFYQSPWDQNQGTQTGFDHGAIFVYMQSENQMVEEENAPQRMGSEDFSRFGSCLAAIGDLDGDGYEDLAVGAPFMEVERGTGAVYIYMGSKSGLEKEPYQIIRALPDHRGFGSSITQHLQIVAGKGYDVAVGSYDSDKVLVFRSKEVLEVTWGLNFSESLDFLKGSCYSTVCGGFCPCSDAEVCVKYQGKFNKFEDSLFLDFNIALATDSSHELFFEENSEAEIKITISVREHEKFCQTLKVFAKPRKLEQFSYPFTAELSLANEEKNVILEQHSSVLKTSAELAVFVQCGSGVVSECKSDINLQCDVLAPYTYDSEAMKLKFEVQSQGDVAYDARLIIKSDDVFNIKEADTNGTVCDKNGKEIECHMGSLVDNDEKIITLDLSPAKETLQPSSLANHPPFFKMTAEVVTISSVSNPGTAVKDIQVDIIVPNSLKLVGKASDPSLVVFSGSSYYQAPEDAKEEEKLGPEIKHEYSILNPKNLTIPGANLTIHWPLTIDGKYFLYLLEKPSFSGVQHICHYPDGEPDLYSLVRPTLIRHPPEEQSKAPSKNALILGMGNKSPVYMRIICPLEAFLEVTIKLRSRLVFRTLAELSVGTAVTNASVFVDFEITKMPFNVDLPPALHVATETKISYKDDKPEVKVPVWLYVVSVFGALLVLSIITIILWKCGFFKRKRAPDGDEAVQELKEVVKEEGEGVDDDEMTTPTSPMLKETECAMEDFNFRSSFPSDNKDAY